MKIPSLYLDDGKIAPSCAWVTAGEGTASVKLPSEHVRIVDHRPMLLRDGEWRRAQAGDDAFLDAWQRLKPNSMMDGDYELVGPSVKGNPLKLHGHRLYPRAQHRLVAMKVDRDYLGRFFAASPAHGIVWAHEDGRMAQVERAEFAGVGV